jgi:hypothetical protein
VPAPPTPAVQPVTAPAPPSRRALPTPAQAQQPPLPPPPPPVSVDDARAVPIPPSPALAPQSRAQRVTAPPTPAPPKVMVPVQRKADTNWAVGYKVTLPAEGQQLVETFDADVAAIYKEIEPKVEARRQAAIKSLEALQDQLTKAGKLDEAVAIRDYLRAGGPPASGLFRYSFFNKGK